MYLPDRLGTMEFPLLKRRRLALLFLLGVGVPSLALSLLAFRGIQNELALMEQRQLDEYRALAAQLSDSLLDRIDRAELSFSRLVEAEEGGSPAEMASAFDSLKAHHPLVDVVFLIDEDERIHLPPADLLYRADGAMEVPAAVTWPAQAAEGMRRGQEQEFRQDQPEAAFISYQRAFDSVSDPELRGLALLAMTRAQRKAGDWDGALAACETLLRDYGAVRTVEGMPLGPVALLEQGRMLLAREDSLRALISLTELYSRLMAGAWALEKAQYEFLARQAAASIEELTGSLGGSVADSLAHAFAAYRGVEAIRRQRTQQILLFQETGGEDLLSRSEVVSQDPGNLSRRFSMDIGGRTYLVSILEGALSDSAFWGLVMDSRYLTDFLLLPVLRAQVDTAATQWMVRGRDGRTILARTDSPSGSLAVNATFAGGFPPWLMEFYRRPQSPYRLFLASGQSIYLYMFLAIATILSFGLVLTVRAITQEVELARLKSDFVSTVSHEFKSPLTSIRQLAEMLQSGRVPSEDRRQRYYDILAEQSARLSTLVTNVLDLARIEEGRREFRFQVVDVPTLLRELVETTQHRVGHDGFEIEIRIHEPLPPVRADPEALTQAVSNLLGNAIQYSGQAKQVEVMAWSEGGTSVVIAVEDSGAGILENEVGKVFDRFYRGSNEVTRSIRGSGLGLTLVKEIVDAHGGSVEVASEVGKGSRFRIKLPAMMEAKHG